jgi:hypothetical protein
VWTVTELQTVSVETLPPSVEAYRTLRDRLATSPQGGAAMMIVALLLYSRDAKLGQACLAVAVDRSQLVAGPHGYRDWQLRNRDLRRIAEQTGAQPYLAQAYIDGATPENGYRLPELPWTIRFEANPHSGDPASGAYKVFVTCSGAGHPRPVSMQRNARGLWKAREWSSLLTGIQPPVQVVEDDL